MYYVSHKSGIWYFAQRIYTSRPEGLPKFCFASRSLRPVIYFCSNYQGDKGILLIEVCVCVASDTEVCLCIMSEKFPYLEVQGTFRISSQTREKLK